MKSTDILYALALFTSPALFAADSAEFVINLKNPHYEDGSIMTEEGGVITAPDLRVQARCLTYTHKPKATPPVQTLAAEGDLMMHYQGRVYVGQKLYFDLLTHTGCLIGGKTAIDIWYLGGEEITLDEDKTLHIQNGFLTTFEWDINLWEITTSKAMVNKEGDLHAKDVRFKVGRLPLLWVPTYKTNLQTSKEEAVISYPWIWDEGIGFRPAIRYRFFASETWSMFARFEYRFTHGPGGALEAEYKSKDERTTFLTRNYGAVDKVFPDERGSTRFRFQGLLKTKSSDERTRFHLQWDRMSDKDMIRDFDSKDFEVKTDKMTYLQFSHYDRNAFGALTVRPKINRFQSINQELPYYATGIRPFEIGRTGIISENYATGSYFKYTYASQVDDFLKDPKSGRLETINTLYRPFALGGLTLTPRAGVIGIYYSDSPDDRPARQLLGHYGGEGDLSVTRAYSSFTHFAQAYGQYLGYTQPQTPVDDYFVFDIHDGYARLNQLRFGVRQLFFDTNRVASYPNVRLDLYAYSFWGAHSFDKRIPKVFADLDIYERSYAFTTQWCWNLDQQLLDYGNARLLYTVNDRLAFGVEMRHRSRFWWRKADGENYVVDAARTLPQLVHSPMSDRRNTLLTRIHIRLSPRWQLHLQTHHGWGRSTEPAYHGARAELYTMVTGNFRFQVAYEYSPNEPWHFEWDWELIH